MPASPLPKGSGATAARAGLALLLCFGSAAPAGPGEDSALQTPPAAEPLRTPSRMLDAVTGNAEAEVLWASGIVLEEYRGSLRRQGQQGEWGLLFMHTGFDLDYQPEIFGFDTSLSETRRLLATDGSWNIAERVSLQGGLTFYDGFSDYRSLWISEYYRQLFGEVPGYSAPDPQGWSASAELRWEYIPLNAWLEFSASTGRDVIAPAWDFGSGGLDHATARLKTDSLALTAENVLHPRVITRAILRWTDTTHRENRWSLDSETHLAIGERWVLRLQAGGAIEDPSFDAYYFGGALDWEFRDGLYVGLSGRYYTDTGEIENSLGGFDSSAPSLETIEAGLALRWQGGNTSAKIFAGYLDTDYGALSPDNAFLSNLYRDREWGVVQLSLSHTF